MSVLNLLIFLSINTNHTPEFVKDYHNITSKKDEQIFIKKYHNNNSIDVKAYVISLKIKQAKYETFPWRKLAVFNREKKKLNQLIKSNPNNVHLRYVRLVIQENAPKILGYHKFINEDKLFLKSVLESNDKTDYLDTYILKNTSL